MKQYAQIKNCLTMQKRNLDILAYIRGEAVNLAQYELTPAEFAHIMQATAESVKK